MVTGESQMVKLTKRIKCGKLFEIMRARNHKCNKCIRAVEHLRNYCYLLKFNRVREALVRTKVDRLLCYPRTGKRRRDEPHNLYIIVPFVPYDTLWIPQKPFISKFTFFTRKSSITCQVSQKSRNLLYIVYLNVVDQYSTYSMSYILKQMYTLLEAVLSEMRCVFMV